MRFAYNLRMSEEGPKTRTPFARANNSDDEDSERRLTVTAALRDLDYQRLMALQRTFGLSQTGIVRLALAELCRIHRIEV